MAAQYDHSASGEPLGAPGWTQLLVDIGGNGSIVRDEEYDGPVIFLEIARREVISVRQAGRDQEESRCIASGRG